MFLSLGLIPAPCNSTDHSLPFMGYATIKFNNVFQALLNVIAISGYLRSRKEELIFLAMVILLNNIRQDLEDARKNMYRILY